jgi:hypothetical protein
MTICEEVGCLSSIQENKMNRGSCQTDLTTALLCEEMYKMCEDKEDPGLDASDCHLHLSCTPGYAPTREETNRVLSCYTPRLLSYYRRRPLDDMQA